MRLRGLFHPLPRKWLRDWLVSRRDMKLRDRNGTFNLPQTPLRELHREPLGAQFMTERDPLTLTTLSLRDFPTKLSARGAKQETSSPWHVCPVFKTRAMKCGHTTVRSTTNSSCIARLEAHRALTENEERTTLNASLMAVTRPQLLLRNPKAQPPSPLTSPTINTKLHTRRLHNTWHRNHENVTNNLART
jgi:hypothetical protein